MHRARQPARPTRGCFVSSRGLAYDASAGMVRAGWRPWMAGVMRVRYDRRMFFPKEAAAVMRGSRSTRWAFAAFGAFVLLTGTAGAAGVTRIQQSDGAVQVYQNVTMRLVGQTLWLRSHDHKGVLEVTTGACYSKGEIQRCLPFQVTLHQHGVTHEIALVRGAVYTNTGDTVHQMRHSSQQLGPHQVLVELHTQRGTFVSVKGTLDEVR